MGKKEVTSRGGRVKKLPGEVRPEGNVLKLGKDSISLSER